MSKFKLVKNWISKHKRFIIVGGVLFALLVAAIFGVTFSLSRIYGSAYDVDSIGSNIDKIEAGDKIKYTANGYSDWKVLSIDKKNHTIDIVSNGSVGDLTINYSDRDKYLDILQEEANKYLNGKHALSARSISDSRAELGSVDANDFWISGQRGTCIYHGSGEFCYQDYEYENIEGDFLPLVTLNVQDLSVLNVGDYYEYSLNGVNSWKILYKNESSISIIPTSSVHFIVRRNTLPNFLDSEIAKFKSENVLDVRAVNSEDQQALDQINYWNNCFYTGEIEYESNLLNEEHTYSYVYDSYKLKQYNCGTNNFEIYTSWTNGFVPIITLKYDKDYDNRKDANTELKVGDFVNYSANAYDSWQVLNINKENNTVDVISSGIVKNLTLSGKEDYDNYETILQETIQGYKIGDNALSVRNVSVNDFERMEQIGIRLDSELKFFLDDKRAHRYRYDNGVSYSVLVGYKDQYGMSLATSWYELGYLYIEEQMSSSPNRKYSVTAGIYPVITLKLSDVKKGTAVKVDDSKFAKEQNKANVNAEVVTEEELAKSEEVTEDSVKDASENDSNDELVEVTYILNDIKGHLKDLKNIAFVGIVLLAGILGFALINKVRKNR